MDASLTLTIHGTLCSHYFVPDRVHVRVSVAQRCMQQLQHERCCSPPPARLGEPSTSLAAHALGRGGSAQIPPYTCRHRAVASPNHLLHTHAIKQRSVKEQQQSDRADARARKRARAGRRGIARACARAAQKAKKQQKRCSGSRAVAKCSSSLWGVTLNAAAKLAQVMAPSREPMRDRVGSARRAEHIPSSARARTRWERSEPVHHGRRSRASLAAPKVPSAPPQNRHLDELSLWAFVGQLSRLLLPQAGPCITTRGGPAGSPQQPPQRTYK